MRGADVVVAPRLGRGDGLRFTLGRRAGIPFGRFGRGGRAREIAHFVKGPSGPFFDPNAGPEEVYFTLRAPISTLSTPSAIGRVGPATFDGGGGGHTTTDRPLRESPHRVAIGAAGDLIAARGDRVLFVVDLVNHR